MTEKETVKINIQIMSSVNVKDPVFLLPEDKNHPLVKAAKNDALIIKVDEYKMMKVEEEEEKNEG